MINANEARNNVKTFEDEQNKLFEASVNNKLEAISAVIESLSKRGYTSHHHCGHYTATREAQALYEKLTALGYKVERTSATTLKIEW